MKAFDLASVLNLPSLPADLNKVERQMKKSVNGNSELDVLALDLLKTPGKRLRPSLLIAVAAGLGKKADDIVIKAAAAVELLHLASLVHDDILDNAELRWHKPTLSVSDSGQALLLGDYLVAKSMIIAAEVSANCAQVLADTYAQMCAGQSREIADKYNQKRTEKSYFQAVRGKTGALFAAACTIGGTLSGSSQNHIEALASFGENFGVAYQVIDDVLDFVSTEKLLGKPVGQDAAEGVYALPLIISLDGSNGSKLRSMLKNKKSLASLTKLLKTDGSLDKAISTSRNYANLAMNELDAVNEMKFTGIKNLPNAYLDWTMENLIT